MRLRFIALSFAAATAFAFVASVAKAQRPYIGYVYPAGGQQGTTFQVRIGGQGLDGLEGVTVSGKGVSARIVEYLPRLNNQELTLIQEQLRELRTAQRSKPAPATTNAEADMGNMMMMAAPADGASASPNGQSRSKEDTKALMERIEARVAGFVQIPACVSISNVAVVQVVVAPDADPGDREIRLNTVRGVSNPMVFQVGTLREYSAKPMGTSPQQILGKEAQALRKRGPKDADTDIELPCVANGQLGPGEINRYHFRARKGQRLVFAAECRYLIPYIADAVPGWFQAVLSVQDANGREVSYNDDFGFKPDPAIFLTVPSDGEYTLEIRDAIYRGREDFIYRISMGELPVVTSCFPLGGQSGVPTKVRLDGFNLPEAEREQTVTFGATGVQRINARTSGMISSSVPFMVDALPAVAEVENNNTEQTAQLLSRTVIVDGRIDSADDVDMFRVSGKEGDTLAIEVTARRLDSALDSFVTLSDAKGNIIALNDDTMDLGDGVNTHHADSYLLAKLPASGDYFIRLTDRAHKGGAEYGYRLRIGAPQPDFELRVVPSSLALRYNTVAPATVYVLRKDDYDGPVRLSLEDAPPGFTAQPVFVPKGQTVGRLQIKAPAKPTLESVSLKIVGTAKIGGRDRVHTAVAAEDRMQAFLWRQLVPAGELVVTVFDPGYTPPTTRPLPVLPKPATSVAVASTTTAQTTVAASTAPALTAPANGPTGPATGTLTTATTTTEPPKPKFTKQQVAGRLRQLKLLYEAGLLTDAFYLKKVEECETAL